MKAAVISVSMAIAIAGSAASAAAAPSDQPSSTWIANGTVWSATTIGDTLYMGGSFTEVSPPTGGGIAVDPSTGVRDGSMAEVLGTVRAVAPSPSGGWYVGGSFTYVGGQPRAGLAYIKPDGTVGSWNPKPKGGRVFTMALSPDGATLYVGGSFTTLKGQPRARLASFSTSGNGMTSWSPAVGGGSVNAIAVSPDSATVYVGGTFSSVDGSGRARLAAFDATGTLSSAWQPAANAEVNALAADSETVYAGGAFSMLGSDSRHGLGAIAASGDVVSWTGTGTDGGVQALSVAGSRLFVGGNFTTLDGEARSYLGSVDTSSGEVDTWAPPIDASVLALSDVTSGGAIAVGGNFLSVGSEPARRLALIDTTTGAAASGWAPNPNAAVRALALSSDDATLYAGGSFTGAGGVLRSRLAALDLATGEPTEWSPSADKDVYAVSASPDGSTIYVGGKFGRINGASRTKLAAIDAASGELDTSFRLSANGKVRALATMGPSLFVGGDYTKLGGLTRARLAAVDIASETVIGSWDPGADLMVRTLLATPSDGRLYVGGDFSNIGGTTKDHIAALDAATGTVISSFTPWGPRHRTFQLAADSTNVYAAMGGPGGGRLRAYAVSNGYLMWEATADGDVQAVTVAGGLVYIGGHFDTLLGEPRGSIGTADPATGAIGTWNPRANGSVWTLGSDVTRVYSGGDFTKVAGVTHHGLAVFE